MREFGDNFFIVILHKSIYNVHVVSRELHVWFLCSSKVFYNPIWFLVYFILDTDQIYTSGDGSYQLAGQIEKIPTELNFLLHQKGQIFEKMFSFA